MWVDVSFGANKAGLSAVGYRQYKSDGTDAVARTTTGVVEIGHGGYGVEVTPDIDAVGIEWDTGEASPLYAHESLQVLWQNVEGSLTLEGAIRLILAAVANKLSGAGTPQIIIRDLADTKNRLVVDGDATGNRITITRDAT